MSADVPTPVAFQALIAKLTELADERGIKLSEVAEIDELTAAAGSLLTRAETDQARHFAAKQIVQEVVDEKILSGEWTLTDGTIGRNPGTS